MATLPTTRLSSLLPMILPFAIGCPEPFALFQARMAAIEFCERTKCWRQIVTMDITENGTSIIPQSSAATIFAFEEATLDGNPLTPTQFTDADPDELSESVATGMSRWITQIAPGEVAIYPFNPGRLRVSCFLKPRNGQLFGTDPTDPMFDAYNVIPAFMFEQNASALASGALARILMTRGEPFADPERAAIEQAKFNAACTSHSASAMKGQQIAPRRTLPRWI